jgi:hypothetical protein
MKTVMFGLLFSIPLWTGGNPYPTIGAIPFPAGYHRLTERTGTFGSWLRTVPLKKGTTVYLFNGRPKENQDAQFAVLDVSVGHEDLQQCADAVMRLNFGDRPDKGRASFDKYLREVFAFCSTRTLAK